MLKERRGTTQTEFGIFPTLPATDNGVKTMIDEYLLAKVPIDRTIIIQSASKLARAFVSDEKNSEGHCSYAICLNKSIHDKSGTELCIRKCLWSAFSSRRAMVMQKCIRGSYF